MYSKEQNTLPIDDFEFREKCVHVIHTHSNFKAMMEVTEKETVPCFLLLML